MQIEPDEDNPHGLYWACGMALRLLAERARGRDSEWATWIDSLPQPGSLVTPLACSAEELEHVRDPATVEEVQHLRQMVDSHLWVRIPPPPCWPGPCPLHTMAARAR